MAKAVTESEYVSLAEVRYRIRRFLTFSEAQAREVGLEPQQHQLLLAIRGLPAGLTPTIGHLAERLQVAHNSAVELASRSVDNGLIEKRASELDRRAVLLIITAKGKRVLEKLAVAHRGELRSTAPGLLHVMQTLLEAPSP